MNEYKFRLTCGNTKYMIHLSSTNYEATVSSLVDDIVFGPIKLNTFWLNLQLEGSSRI